MNPENQNKSLQKKVYNIVKKIPKGKVTTYKNIGVEIKTKAYRAIGNALNKNTDFEKIPCHRVVRSNGEIGGYVKGKKAKEQLLKKEGITIKKGKITRLKNFL